MRTLQPSITLRYWNDDDFQVYKKWHDGTFKWMELNGPYYPVKTIDDVNQEIQQIQEALHHNRNVQRMVIADSRLNKLIGTVSWYWQSKATNWISIGLALYDETYWNKGLGYQALGLWCDYLFKHFPTIARLDLRTWSGNIGMLKLAEKIGFLLEARFRKARIVNGNYYDSIGYGILREEWYEKFPDGFTHHMTLKNP